MKRVLITGAGSYIGTNVEQYLLKFNAEQGYEHYRIDTISQIDDSWEEYNFAPYDVVFDVTGIAHADIGKVSEEEKKLYYQVNCNLAVKTAIKAKKEGVSQFIYMSSIIVYGDSAPIGKEKHITAQTTPNPSNFYGDSKWQAECHLKPLNDKEFKVAILRPPFIYGSGSKGNYPLLAKLATKLPVFPTIKNQRSMLYIENLCEFVRLLIESKEGGVFFPQNAEYSTTYEVVGLIAKAKGKKIYGLRGLNPFVKLASLLPGKIGRMTNKAFGNLTYDKSMSKIPGNYHRYNLEESIERTENGF